MKTKFKPTPERSKILLNWLLEEKTEQSKLFDKRIKIIRSELTEEEEQKMLQLNTEMYKESRLMEDFCRENIVSYHLNTEDLTIFESTKRKTKDDSNFQL